MRKKVKILSLVILFCTAGFSQTDVSYKVPLMPDTTARKAMLQREWQAMQMSPPQIAVRECFMFLLDALDTRFLKDEQVEWLLKKVQTRMISNPAAGKSYGNIFWGWHEQGSDIGDGNNIEFCMQYGILIKILFNDRLSAEARKTLDEIFQLGIQGARNQKVRVSYTNIYLMKIWNFIAFGQVYNQPLILEEGKAYFDQWLNHVARYGNREYDSPTYSGIDLESLLLIHTFSTDADIKAKAADVLDFFITDLSAHYNRRAGILSGAHSRDYNRVFSRDLLEEKYFNPLLGEKNNNDHLFNQICTVALEQLGLSARQKELINRKNRFIVQRWDSMPHTYAADFIGNKVSIASTNQAYSPDDKPFIMYLSSERIPAMPNIVYVLEGRDDHYGTWSAEGKGEKLKHLMPANYPSNGGWNKTRHLMPFMQSAQNKGEFVMLVAGEKDHNCIKDYLNSTVILPDYFDEIWMGNHKIKSPGIGDSIAMDKTKTFFAKFEDVAIAIRVLWNDMEKEGKAILYNDGFKYTSPRKGSGLTHNEALRLTLKHSNNGKAAMAMWWKEEEGIRTAADFLKFRNKVLTAPVSISNKSGVIDISVTTPHGKLGVKGDIINKKRIAYYNPVPLPKDFLFSVDGVEIGKPVMEKYIQKKVVLDHFFNNEINTKTGKPFHYLWTDTAMSGFSQLGKLFRSKGAEITTLEAAPTAKNLKDASVYIIVDPDTKEETLKPNYMTENSANEIADWVKKGGVLLLMTNDVKNAELDSINILASKFGMHFNKDQIHPVSGRNWEMGASKNLPDHPLFKDVNKIYLKEVSSIRCSNNAKAILTEENHVLIADCSYSKGHVYAIGDPWIYNEYIDHWLLPESFENKKAATNLVELLLNKSK